MTGTGHNSIAYSPDGREMFCVYHARTSETGEERVVCIDRMEVKNGIIKVLGPTTTPRNCLRGWQWQSMEIDLLRKSPYFFSLTRYRPAHFYNHLPEKVLIYRPVLTGLRKNYVSFLANQAL